MSPQRIAAILVLVLTSLACSAVPVVDGPGAVNNASYSSSPGIARGSIFAVFGENLGPEQLQVVGSFPLPTRLAGTSIRLSVAGQSVDALMLYASASQVGAVLPSSTPLGEGTLTVNFEGQTSAAVPVNIVDQAPGLFTVNQRGTGPASVTDENYALIGRDRPAYPGQTVIFWATGLGPVSGEEAAGPLPGPMPGAGVMIGGRPATVLYAGRSGCCAGLDQIHVVIPQGLGGCDVPVQLTAGGVTSNTATIAIAPPGASCDQAQPPAAAQITLNPATRYQTIRAWEATAYVGQDHAAFPLFRDTVFDRAASELGITRLRVEIRSGVENTQDYWSQFQAGQISNELWRCLRYATVNDNSDPFSINWAGFQFADLDDAIERVVLPLKQRLAARGEKLEINLNYVAFVRQMTATGCPSGLTYVHDDSPEEYAEFVLATYLHLQQKYGWVPDYWEVVLEPDNTPFWRGPEIGRAIVAAAARLRANGFTPRFIAPSTTDMGHGWIYFDAMVSQVPAAAREMVELSYHRYGGVLLSNLQTIAARARQYGIGAAMLEHIGSGYQDLHQDLKVGNNVAWQQYTLASPAADNGGAYYVVDVSRPNQPVVRMGQRTPFLRQYFRYIRPGAVRIEASTNNAAMDPVAFINSDGKYVVVINASSGGTVSINGLPAGPYGITYATTQEPNGALADVVVGPGQPVLASMPASGVLTVYGK